MILDAILAYLHFVSIFALFGFLTAEAILIRRALDAGTIRLLGRVDIFYFGAAIAVLVSGFLRLVLGVKGADFYLQSWPIYAKIGLFVVVAVISVAPTLVLMAMGDAAARRRARPLISEVKTSDHDMSSDAVSSPRV